MVVDLLYSNQCLEQVRMLKCFSDELWTSLFSSTFELGIKANWTDGNACLFYSLDPGVFKIK